AVGLASKSEAQSLDVVRSLPRCRAGGSLSSVTLMAKVCAAEVSTPPFAVPPSSCAAMVTVAMPFAFGAGVKVSVPLAPTVGCAEKSVLSLLLTLKLTVCDDSFGPGEIAVAQLVCE